MRSTLRRSEVQAIASGNLLETRVRGRLVALRVEGGGQLLDRPWIHRLTLAAIVSVSLATLSYGLWFQAPLTSLPLPTRVPGVTPIERVIVIMKENHGFDNYFGTYPGADGIPENASLPDGAGRMVKPHWLDATWTFDLPHSRADMLEAFDGGKNDLFAAVAERVFPGLGNISVGYYDDRQVPYYWSLARNFTLADRYFSSMLGPTDPNRLFSIAGTAGGLANNPLYRSGVDVPTIFDQLEAQGISWRYYGITNDLEITTPLQLPHIAANGAMSSKVLHLDTVASDITAGRLPSVTYIDPNGYLADSLKISEHPPGDVTDGQAWTAGVIDAIMASPIWPSCVVFLTWDESGGFYDHVPPPQVDEWGYGFCLPMQIVWQFLKRGVLDYDVMDHTSILKFIATNWNLSALTPREANASDMMSAFAFPAGEARQIMASLNAPDSRTAVDSFSFGLPGNDSNLTKDAERVRFTRVDRSP